MADNVPITAGAGTSIATDEVTGTLEHVQLVKLAYSADGVRTLVPVDVDGLLVNLGVNNDVTVASLPLPAGASTSALQTTGNTSVGSIDTKTPALGQQLAAASSPVVLTAAQITTLTPPAAITGFALEAGHLAAIDTSTARIPAPGQALAAASTPVVLTAIQVAALTPVANATVNVAQMAGVAPSLNTGVRDAGTLRVTVATNDVVPVSGTVTTSPPANASTNVAQVAGTATDVNSGLKSAGTIRVVLATDQPALTNKLLVTPDSVALPANQSVNVNQLVGAAPSATNPLPARDGDGTGFYSSDVLGAFRYKKVSMVQDIEVSASNSSTTNLASAASFTGTSQTTLGVAAIQVCLFADQNCTIQVQQAQEDPGVNWNIVDSWTYTANSTGMDAARTIQAVASSLRVIVTNNGGSTTTAFRLQTVVAPIADSLPRGLTQLGNLKTALIEALPTGANVIGTVTANAGTNLNTSALLLDATFTGRLPAAAASADGLTNPTITQIGADAMVYNGTTWDRARGNWRTTTGDTGAKTVTFNGATQTNFDSRGAWITIQLGTVSGTTPTLSCQLQYSFDAGTTWLNFGAALANLTTSNQTGLIIVYPANISQAAGTTPATLTSGATVMMAINASRR